MHEKELCPRAVADPELGIVLAAADILLAPEQVFRAFTVPALIEHWWGAAAVYRMTNWQQQLHNGGGYTVDVRRPDGQVFPASGRFFAVYPPHYLVYTRRYEWDFPVLGRRETVIHYHFNSHANGTRVTIRHEGFAGFNEAAEEHAAGWERVLHWLLLYARTPVPAHLQDVV
jgi:uncharacterized protein YndB with AHSA1/START domain